MPEAKWWENIPAKSVRLHVVVWYKYAALLNASKPKLYVQCMRRIKGQNSFYWPKKLKDVC